MGRLVRVLALVLMPFVGFADSVDADRGTIERSRAPRPAAQEPPSRASMLRGEYGRYRANNDLRFYYLDIRVDPERKLVSGKNAVRFKMLRDDTRIQLELFANLNVDRIMLGTTPQSRAASHEPATGSLAH